MTGSILWGAPLHWTYLALGMATVALAALAWSYWRAPAHLGVRSAAALLKTLGILALAICLAEPLFSGMRPRPGANLFVMLADNSQSMQIHDADEPESRGRQTQQLLTKNSAWRTRLEQDFDVRRYAFDSRLRAVDDFESLDFQGGSSALSGALDTVAKRFGGRAMAGVLLFSDGNCPAPLAGVDLGELPPVYPVLVGADSPPPDIAIDRISVSQTNFEESPITVRAEISASGYEGRTIVAQLLDSAGVKIDEQSLDKAFDQRTIACRFQFRPREAGISFYRVRVFAKGEHRQFEEEQRISEATLANNQRYVVVDRGGGPYNILYVCGRPNWEFKFLRRALQADDEVDLVGLIRIAKREPKFEFRDIEGTKNKLFDGFEKEEDEEAESYDQPVLMRVGVDNPAELRDGFPQAADELFGYHAVVLDDVESAFFTQDQMSLLQAFVNHRGGGLLMLGGQESFNNGQYDRTPIGDMLPVYLDRDDAADPSREYRLSLTREGWLQPWVRVRDTEEEERRRLSAMPAFQTLNRAPTVKPGAAVLAEVQDERGDMYPALVAQRFGAGRTSAMLIGDMWRWSLSRGPDEKRDLETAWRQLARWLVSEAPARVAVDVERTGDDADAPVRLRVRLKTPEFEPLDNATVAIEVTAPDGGTAKLTAAGAAAPGEYETTYTSRAAGPYLASVVAVGPDGDEVGRRQAGWTAEPAAEEFTALTPNKTLLEEIARETGGEVIPAGEMAEFVASLPNRKIPITEHWVYPLWHTPSVFLFAIACLCAEWGLRRFNGLP